MGRTANYDKYANCTNCGITYNAARIDDPLQSFCSDKCRASWHREENKRKQFYVGSQIIGDLMKTEPETVRNILGEKGVSAALKNNGYTWSSKHKTYKNRDGVLWNYERDLFSDQTDAGERPEVIPFRFKANSNDEGKKRAYARRADKVRVQLDRVKACEETPAQQREVRELEDLLKAFEAEAR